MDTRSPGRVPERAEEPLADAAGRPLGELLRTFAHDAALLVRAELALARAEVGRALRALARGAVLAAIGAAVGLTGLLVLLAALVLAVGDLLGERYALGALVVGGALLALGGGMAMLGVRAARRTTLAPAQTLATAGDAEDEARGRKERAPLPVSAPLWKRVLHAYTADDLANQAAKVAYYFFLSLPPALMAVFGLTGFFGGPQTADWLTGRLSGSLPAEASGLVTGFVRDVVHGRAPGALSVGLLLALWSGAAVFSALEDTLNDAFGITAERSFIRRKAVAVGMLAACAVLFLAGSAVLLGGGRIAEALGLGEAGRTAWGIAQVPLGFALITATFWLVYYVLPNRDQRACRGTLLRASAVAAALFVVVSLAFRLYISRFGSYGATYGLLGTVIVLLLWMYVTSLVVLLGGEVAAEMERRA